MLWVYIPTGIGGLTLTYLLFVSRLVPRLIAVLGFVGYVSLSLGVPLTLLGVLDMNEGPGLVLLAPGGTVRSRGPADLADHQGIQVTVVRTRTQVTRVGDDRLTHECTALLRLRSSALLRGEGRWL